MASTPETDLDPHQVHHWENRWVKNHTGFHETRINETLIKHMELVTGQKLTIDPVTDPDLLEQNSKKIWFVPLCGKTFDIPYLLSQGFRVFGIEAVKLAIDQFISEHNLELTFDEGQKLYTGFNGRLQIYAGDLFECPVEKFGPFDYVWDRAAFIALECPLRQKYIDFMQRSVKKADGTWHNFRYLLDTIYYDIAKFGQEPPTSVSDEDIKEYYESWTNIQLLSSVVIPETSPLYRTLKEDGRIRVHFATPKQA